MSRESKIIFPSTHVIFDGLQKFKDNLLESEVPCPSLVYSKSKYKNEQDIISSGKNFIILRLGSVYGFSEDSTRVNILPNLFSKISALNQTIRLFSGGEQIKNLVSLIDVARCFNFMEQNININKEIFNCVKETCSVKDIASICKKYSSNLKIVSSNDPVPNPGYKLSNKKIIKTGFKFLFDLDTSIKEMISKWSTLDTDNKIEIVKNIGKMWAIKKFFIA
jgi:dTDP-4-dehydrorhamnose reductase